MTIIVGKAINIETKKILLDSGEIIPVAYKDVGKYPGCTCHFSSYNCNILLTAKWYTLDGKRYEIKAKVASMYINNMWTFHAVEIENGIN